MNNPQVWTVQSPDDDWLEKGKSGLYKGLTAELIHSALFINLTFEFEINLNNLDFHDIPVIILTLTILND